MSALSTPMPKAMVATITSLSEAMKASCTAARCSAPMPAW